MARLAVAWLNDFALVVQTLLLMSTSIVELQAKRRRIGEELGALRRDLSRANRAASAAQRQWVLTEELRRIVLLMYVLSGYRVDAAVNFLSATGRQRHWPERREDELSKLVEQCFLDTSEGFIAHLCDEVSPLDEQAFRAAADRVVQWQVSVWTARQNHAVGVAPPTETCVAEFGRRLELLPEPVRPTIWAGAHTGTMRKRASRWRRRYGGRIGTVKARDELPRAALREKVLLNELVEPRKKKLPLGPASALTAILELAGRKRSRILRFGQFAPYGICGVAILPLRGA